MHDDTCQVGFQSHWKKTVWNLYKNALEIIAHSQTSIHLEVVEAHPEVISTLLSSDFKDSVLKIQQFNQP